MGMLADYIEHQTKKGETVNLVASSVTGHVRSYSVRCVKDGYVHICGISGYEIAVKVNMDDRNPSIDYYTLSRADWEKYDRFEHAMGVADNATLEIAKQLIKYDTINLRLFKASQLLNLPWVVQRRKNGQIINATVIDIEEGHVLINGTFERHPCTIYGDQLMDNPGDTPWLLDTECQLYIEANRVLRLYNETVTTQRFDKLMDVLPWYRLGYIKHPVVFEDPAHAVFLIVDPIRQDAGYRVDEQDKLVWVDNINKKALKYDEVELI